MKTLTGPYIYGFGDDHFLNNNKKTRRGKTRRRSRRKGRHGKQVQQRPGIGQTIGAKLGGFAEEALRKSPVGRLFGMGEYKEALAHETGVGVEEIASGDLPTTNSMVAPLSSNELVPVMHSSKEGSIVVSRREFITTVEIKNQENYLVFPINPGLDKIFPWLSTTVAQGFQSYNILGLAIEYVPLSGYAVGSNSAALGTVGMAFLYDIISDDMDSGEWPVGDFKGLLNLEGAVSGTPATPMSCYLECDPALRPRNTQLIRTPQTIPAANNYSLQDYDYGQFLIRFGGSQNTDTPFVCGQLWVTYEIALHFPRAPDTFTGLSILDYMDPLYRDMLKDYLVAQAESGPFTNEAGIARAEALGLLRANFSTPGYLTAYARALADLRRAELAADTAPPTTLPDFLRMCEEYKGESAPQLQPGDTVRLTQESLVDPKALVKDQFGWQTVKTGGVRSALQSPAPSLRG